MSIYRLEAMGVDCHVVASCAEVALKVQGVDDYFAERDLDDLIQIEELPPDRELSIDLDGTVIRHTAAEWSAIYEMCGPRLICSSEY